MLTDLDGTLLHQSAVPFSQTTVSDHRFFDRMWIGGHQSDGTRFLMGMANYKNMNAADGYFVVLKGKKQYNVRVSRPFLDNPSSTQIGPLSMTVIEPLKKIKIKLESTDDQPISAEITFTATVTPRMEKPHRGRVDGRLAVDYVRYDQHGHASGWIKVDDKIINLDPWFCALDHSWGVRPNQGGYDPVTSLSSGFRDEVTGGSDPNLAIYLFFDEKVYEGYLQYREDGAGKCLYLDGGIREKDKGQEVSIVSLEHQLDFYPGTRACVGGMLKVRLVDGNIVDIDIRALLPATCYKGTGYDSGFNDEKGLGLHRGNLVEYDVYDLSHPEDVQLPDGRVIRPWHREQVSMISVNNGPEYPAYLTVLSNGEIPRYNLTGRYSNRVNPNNE